MFAELMGSPSITIQERYFKPRDGWNGNKWAGWYPMECYGNSPCRVFFRDKCSFNGVPVETFFHGLATMELLLCEDRIRFMLGKDDLSGAFRRAHMMFYDNRG